MVEDKQGKMCLMDICTDLDNPAVGSCDRDKRSPSTGSSTGDRTSTFDQWVINEM
jgi:hypothetical protein